MADTHHASRIVTGNLPPAPQAKPLPKQPVISPPPLPASIPVARNATGNAASNAGATPVVRKLTVRERRLIADAEQVAKAFHGFPPIRVQAIRGNPPDLYHVEYSIRGLVRGPDGQPIYRDEHLTEIQLTSEYPRQSPKCKMLTPIFHPNIEPAIICVGDHWTAAERLVDLVIRIGEMVAFQVYNIKSPLDGEAAMWTDHNSQRLPIDRRDLRPPGMA